MKKEARNWMVKHKCPVCGKTFFPAPYHVYKDHRNPDRIVCTWHCVRESERLLDAEREARPQKKRGPKPKSQNEKET